jgi:hypothetical protein
MHLISFISSSILLLLLVTPPCECLRLTMSSIGPLEGLGWVYRLNLGRLKLDQMYDYQIESTFVENLEEGPNIDDYTSTYTGDFYKNVISTCPTTDLYIAGSYGYGPQLHLASQHPACSKTKFVHINGFKLTDSISTGFAKLYQIWYLEGMHEAFYLIPIYDICHIIKFIHIIIYINMPLYKIVL